MTTAAHTGWATTLLDEAAAIVEAEWMRLQQEEAMWERLVADLFAEMPATRPGPGRAALTQHPWSGSSTPDDRRRWPTRLGPATPVLGDPAVSSVARCSADRHCRTREVMPHQ